MNFDGATLFNLLPALYRLRDAQIAASQSPPLAQGPLQDLLGVISEQIAVVENDLAQLYDDLFIETCNPWVIPYIGDLVGYQSVHGIAAAVADPRAEVARTIALRRRKGTVSVLEQLARDVTGWGAHAVEFFELVATYQYMKHARLMNEDNPNVRHRRLRERMDTGFDLAAHFVDVRKIAGGRGRYNVQNIGVFLWSLNAYSLTGAPASNAPASKAPSSKGATTSACYRFDPLGQDIPLFNHQISQGEEVMELAKPENVPDRLRGSVLCHDLAQTNPTYYGSSVSVFVGGVLQDSTTVLVCDLEGPDGSWANTPINPINPVTQKPQYTLAIDPELGRIAFASAPTGAVTTSHYRGFNADMAGGEYSREATFASPMLPVVRVSSQPGGFTTIESAVAALGGAGVVEVVDNATYSPAPLDVTVNAGATIEIRARDGRRPVIQLSAPINVSGGDNSIFNLNGFVVTAAPGTTPACLIESVSNANNSLQDLNVTHCTLVPGATVASGVPNPSIVVDTPGVALSVTRSIVGPLQVHSQATASLADSIVDALSQTNPAYSAPPDQTKVGGGGLTAVGCTLIGTVYVNLLSLASDCIFWSAPAPVAAPAEPVPSLLCDRRQQGCVRFSYLPALNVTPRQYECVTEGVCTPEPLFQSLQYGQPAYAKLFPQSCDAIRRGADDGGRWARFTSFLRRCGRAICLSGFKNLCRSDWSTAFSTKPEEGSMSFDCSRFTFNPWNDFNGLVSQQGRVHLDSEWNESQAQLRRRIQAGTMDTLGRSAFPSTTPNAFRITYSGSAIDIGTGRMYVDGILIENHGVGPNGAWDPALAEWSASPAGSPGTPISYLSQPYYPNPTALPTDGTIQQFYVDVWERPVTYLQYPSLVEQAVGIDTTGRMQTVWQVKFQPGPDPGAPSPCDFTPPFLPSGSQLTTNLVPTAQPTPCSLNSGTGYVGQENQLYRVEIHRGGAAANGPITGNNTNPTSATFKWSRENGSVATRVTGYDATSFTLSVESTGRDNVLGFRPGDWVEINSYANEMANAPGQIVQIQPQGVSAAAGTIQLVGPGVTQANLLPLNFAAPNYVILRRWDQKCKILESDNATTWIDLDASASGEIPVPANGLPLILENGITVAFGISGQPGMSTEYVSGDFWTFAARTDGTIDMLSVAPPQGIHHHYAPLASVNFKNGIVTECRDSWPSCGCCDCTITLQPSDLTESYTLQTIVNKYANCNMAVTICLMPGMYPLPGTLYISNECLSIVACLPGTVCLNVASGSDANFLDGLICLTGAQGITLRGLTFDLPAATLLKSQSIFAGLSMDTIPLEAVKILDETPISFGVRCFGSGEVKIEDCDFKLAGGSAFSVGVFAGQECDSIELTKNRFAIDGERRLSARTAGLVMTPTVGLTDPRHFFPPPHDFGAASEAEKSPAAPQTPEPPAPPKSSRSKKSSPAPAPAAATEPAALAESVAAGPGGGVPPNFFIERLENFSGLAANGGNVVITELPKLRLTDNAFDSLTIAAATIAYLEDIEILRNTVTGCQAGFWLLTPLTAPSILGSFDSDIVAMLGVAMAYPPPLQDSFRSGAMGIAAAADSIRFCASPNEETDSNNLAWQPDKGYLIPSSTSNVFGPPPPGQAAISAVVPYTYFRWGQFSYSVPNLPAGFYDVTLNFQDIEAQPQGRNFIVKLGDFTVETFTFSAAIPDSEDSKRVPGTACTGTMEIAIAPGVGGAITTSPASAPMISAVQVTPQWSTDYAGTFNAGSSLWEQLFLQTALLGQQGYVNYTPSNPRLRIDANEISCGASNAILILGDDMPNNGRAGSLMMIGNRATGSPMGGDYNLPPPAAGTVGISNITSCLVASNSITNAGAADLAYSLVWQSANSQSAISVMGNLLTGSLSTSPYNPPPGGTGSWYALNMIV